MKEETGKWMSSAKSDLVAAKNSLNSKDYGWACFQSQQAVEKFLKAVLIEKTGRFPRAHDLVLLGKSVEIDRDLLEGCERLNPVYIGARYPSISDEEYTEEESNSDIKIAEDVSKWIVKKLS